MIFDKDRALTAFDAYKAKMGMIGWGGNTMTELEQEVKTKQPRALISSPSKAIEEYPFSTTKGDYRYFYPREERKDV